MIALKNNCQNKKGCLEDNEGVLSALLGFLLNYIQWVKPECLDTDFWPKSNSCYGRVSILHVKGHTEL